VRLHREHRHHPWVIETLEETLWHLFVREAVEELRAKGMSIRQATIALAGKSPHCWPISQRLLAMAESWISALGHDILRAVGHQDLERLCHPHPSEQMWRAFYAVHHVYRGHLADTHSLPSFPRALSYWDHLLWRCRYLYELPVIRPPERFDLPH
jgi:hypothetical protein